MTSTTPTFPLMGARATPLATAAQTGGCWEAVEMDLGPGARSPLHSLSADKLFYVAAGRPTLTVGDEQLVGEPGDAVLVPAGTVHCYVNDTAERARLLVVVTGSDQVRFLRGMSALAADGPPDPQAVAAHAAAHGVRLVPALP